MPDQARPTSSIALTLDGTLDDYDVRPGSMRWMPPEATAAIRAARPAARRAAVSGARRQLTADRPA